jgi:predicted XRE-type DNA-binding protein
VQYFAVAIVLFKYDSGLPLLFIKQRLRSAGWFYRRPACWIAGVLMMAISERIRSENLKQEDAAKPLNITQPRVSALLNSKIESFRLDALVDMAHRLGLQVTIHIAA